jgi:hypothetical protein
MCLLRRDDSMLAPDPMKTATILYTHPKLWIVLHDYNIEPSARVLNDIKIMLKLDTEVTDEQAMAALSHEHFTMLKANQLQRVKDSRAKYPQNHELKDLVVVPEKNEKKTKKSRPVTYTSEPSMPTFGGE